MIWQKNGAARGGVSSGAKTRGCGSGGIGSGRGGHVKFGEGEEGEEQGHTEVLIGEVTMGIGEEDGEDKESICDSGAEYHMTGDITLFDKLEYNPTHFYIKQINGKVVVSDTYQLIGKMGRRVCLSCARCF